MTKSMLVNANALRIPLRSGSVHCAITSPPYWGLRDYGTATWVGGDPECDHVDKDKVAERQRQKKSMIAVGERIDGSTRTRVHDEQIGKEWQYRNTCPKCGATRIDNQLGLEPTPEQFIANMVAVFREVWRILRDDGTLWLNLGDCYATGSNGRSAADTKAIGEDDRTFRDKPFSTVVSGLKPKDLVGMPWRVALALQADGWYLRSDIIWAKLNPMPESVTDRPTKSHEYIFLLTKNERYFYDTDAIREEGTSSEYDLTKRTAGRMNGNNYMVHGPGYSPGETFGTANGTRNRRTVWNIEEDEYEQFLAWKAEHARDRKDVWNIATAPYSGAHFATFPPALVEPCIKAGTSERGVCPDCGAPWERVVAGDVYLEPGRNQLGLGTKTLDNPMTNNGKQGSTLHHIRERATTGWQPTCTCFGHFEEREIDDPGDWIQQETGKRRTVRVYVPHEDVTPVPAVVFDPFAGSGTTLLVANQLGRRGIGLDLSMEYLHLAEDRIGHTALAEWTNGKKAAETVDLGPLFR